MPRNTYKQIANAESFPPLSEIVSAKFIYIYIYIKKQLILRNQESENLFILFECVFRGTNKSKKILLYIKSS